LIFRETKTTDDPAEWTKTQLIEWRKTQLVVQPVRLAPERSILFGCHNKKKNRAYAALEEFFGAEAGRSSPAAAELLRPRWTLWTRW
jgi:hypothetical protein